jgi:hypothetical protein
MSTVGYFDCCRAREEELLYVLRKLLELRLWPGTFWAALSDRPSEYCLQQPGEALDWDLLWALLIFPLLFSYGRLLIFETHRGCREALVNSTPIPFLSSFVPDCVDSKEVPINVDDD